VNHVIVTRFSVPRPASPGEPARHDDRGWLAERMELFRRYYVPSVQRTGVPAVLLCSSGSAAWVREETREYAWVRVAVQDGWEGGWRGARDEVLTRLDSDDLIHPGWFAAVATAPAGAEAFCTRGAYMLDAATGAVYQADRSFPVALLALARGRNPYAFAHRLVAEHYDAAFLEGRYLLQVVHGGNVSNAIPAHAVPAPPGVLASFGIA